MDTYYLHEDRIRDVLKIKADLKEPLSSKLPSGNFKTTEPTEKLDMVAWFNHINTSLRTKNKFGSVDLI